MARPQKPKVNKTGRTSAGILLWRRRNGRIEVLLGHTGGPYFARKDADAWTVLKGEVEPGEDYVVTRLLWGGSLLEEARLSGTVKLLTVAPHALAAEEAPAASEPAVNHVTPTLSNADLLVHVTGREEPEGGRASLADARVVVGRKGPFLQYAEPDDL